MKAYKGYILSIYTCKKAKKTGTKGVKNLEERKRHGEEEREAEEKIHTTTGGASGAAISSTQRRYAGWGGGRGSAAQHDGRRQPSQRRQHELHAPTDAQTHRKTATWREESKFLIGTDEG